MEAIHERIRRIRGHLNMTQSEFGKLAKVSKSAVSQWERGDTTPERDALLELQKSIRLDPDFVITGRGSMFLPASAPHSDSSDTLCPEYRRLLSALDSCLSAGTLGSEEFAFLESSVRFLANIKSNPTTIAADRPGGLVSRQGSSPRQSVTDKKLVARRR